MPRTPDRFPGRREDEALLLNPGDTSPAENGEIRYLAGIGFHFREEGVTRPLSGTGGISGGDHASLRQLTHFLDDGPGEGFPPGTFKEVLPSGNPFPTTVTWWDSSSKTAKIVQKTISRNPNQTPSQVQWQVFGVDGSTVLATITDTITYDGMFEATRTRTLT